MNSCTSSGTLRKTSTYTAAPRDSQRFGTVRNTPSSEPRTKAMTQAPSDRVTVHCNPSISQPR